MYLHLHSLLIRKYRAFYRTTENYRLAREIYQNTGIMVDFCVQETFCANAIFSGYVNKAAIKN